MVRKLFKHELYAYSRTVIPMHFILMGIAIMARLVQLFENESATYNIIFYSTTIAFAIGAFVCFLLTLIFGIKRFYTNLFSQEGYLSFTLPVTVNQHIFVKTTVAVIAQLSSLLLIAISVCLITFGDVCKELFKALFYLIKVLYRESGYHASLFIIEFIFALIITFTASYLLYYSCIALGQRAKKNRVAAAVGVYFIYYFISQAISTAFIIIYTVFYEQLHIEEIIEYLGKHPIFTTHLVLIGVTVVYAVLGVIFYAIIKNSIDKKLNLE